MEATLLRGVCESFERGSGQLRDAHGRRWRVHQRNIRMTGFRKLDPGQAVAFTAAAGRGGSRAENVCPHCPCVVCLASEGALHVAVPRQHVRAIVGEGGSNLSRICSLHGCDAERDCRCCTIHCVVHARGPGAARIVRTVRRHVRHRSAGRSGAYEHPGKAVQCLLTSCRSATVRFEPSGDFGGRMRFGQGCCLAAEGCCEGPEGLLPTPPPQQQQYLAGTEFVTEQQVPSLLERLVSPELQGEGAVSVFCSVGAAVFYHAPDGGLPEPLPLARLRNLRIGVSRRDCGSSVSRSHGGGVSAASSSAAAAEQRRLKMRMRKTLPAEPKAVLRSLAAFGFTEQRGGASVRRAWVIDRRTGDKWACTFWRDRERAGRWRLASVTTASHCLLFLTFLTGDAQAPDFRLAVRRSEEVSRGRRRRIRRFLRGSKWDRERRLVLPQDRRADALELEEWVSVKRDRQFVLASGTHEIRACVSSHHSGDTELSFVCRRRADGSHDVATLVRFMRGFVGQWGA